MGSYHLDVIIDTIVSRVGDWEHNTCLPACLRVLVMALGAQMPLGVGPVHP